MVRDHVQILNFLLVLAFSLSTLAQFALLGPHSHWPLHHLGFSTLPLLSSTENRIFLSI